MTSVITSFGMNIEWTGIDFTRWVVIFHSILELESSEIHSSTSGISSLHRWSELFTRFFREYSQTNHKHWYVQETLKNLSLYRIVFFFMLKFCWHFFFFLLVNCKRGDAAVNSAIPTCTCIFYFKKTVLLFYWCVYFCGLQTWFICFAFRLYIA